MPAQQDILIIDDCESLRAILQLTLEMEGYHVISAQNGKEGLELLRKLKEPPLVLLDVMMPVMDGWTFMNMLAEDDELSRTPIILMTAFDIRDRHAQALEVLKKPIEPENLIEAVHRHIH